MRKERIPTKRRKYTGEKNVHFAAVNSGHGFVSYYGEVFGNESIERRYIIKGGPGTGKSSLMKRVAVEAEKKGSRVAYYRCSSDPESLDGIIIDGKTAILDGTAPHLYEPQIAGAADEIINLGEFWDSDKLYKAYNEIAALSALKSAAYGKAYKFLSAAMNVEEINRSLALPALMVEKLKGAVSRLMRDIPDGDGATLEYGFTNAIGMTGLCHLDTYENSASKLYAIYDSYGLGAEFLLEVLAEAKRKGLKIKASFSPLMPDLPDAVMLCDSGICFVICDGEEMDGAQRINVKRFVNSDVTDRIKAEYRVNCRLREALIMSATESLADAGKYHFELEKIYVSCMDFEEEGKFIDVFCRKLLK